MWRSHRFPLSQGLPVSRIGDTWRVGRHKLLCGDARDPAAHAALMGSERGAAVFSDPPYDAAIDGKVSGLGEVRSLDKDVYRVPLDGGSQSWDSSSFVG